MMDQADNETTIPIRQVTLDGASDVDDRVGEVREDVGRHNAVDKLLQKALVAGVSMIVAVGAPSSLAIEMAERG